MKEEPAHEPRLKNHQQQQFVWSKPHSKDTDHQLYFWNAQGSVAPGRSENARNDVDAAESFLREFRPCSGVV